jgi:hypothetical protein
VRGALGPYLNVFLVTQQHWSQEAVGLVTTIGGLLGLAVQTPVGAAIIAGDVFGPAVAASSREAKPAFDTQLSSKWGRRR